MSNPTTPFSWQMPTATDLVTDLPADFAVFGQAVATSMADLLGGASGYILSKASATDMDFSWIANDVGDITAVTVTSPITGGGTSGSVGISIQDASTSQKGAVQLTDSTSTTSSTVAATATAAKAAYDASAGALKPLPYITNNYYSPAFNTTRTTALYAAGTTFYTPIFIRENRTFNRIAIVTGSTFSGTASVRLGIYNISVAGVPTTVLLDAGTVAPSAASQVNEITISQALTPGYYMLAFNVITNATTTSFLSTNVATFPNSADMGAPTAGGNVHVAYTQTVSAASSFATAVSPAASANNPPSILIRA